MENTAFVATNCDLINNPKYQKLDATAMMLYSLYEERVSCSQYNTTKMNKDVSLSSLPMNKQLLSCTRQQRLLLIAVNN